MDFGLRGKTVVVTGSTAGIGLATAMSFAREGARVVVNGRTQARVDRARAEISAKVPRADVIGVAADVGTSAGCEAVVAVAPQADVLINNAGIFEPKAFAQISDADWLRFFEMNVMSGVRLSRALLPGMMARGWGRIVFISSESALQIPAEMIHYGMTKTAQLAISRGLAESAAGTGVTVNSVLPGPTLSEGVGQFVSELARERGVDAKEVEKGFFESMRPSSILKRFATPEEVANMVVYVASAAASATTGAALRVDGGVVRAIA